MAQNDRHDPSLVRIMFRGAPKLKALVCVLSEFEDDLSVQETLTNCIIDRCKAVGIIDKEGKVAPEFEDDVELYVGMIEADKKRKAERK